MDMFNCINQDGSYIKKKLVVVGDHACGKTCLRIMFSRGIFPETRGHGFQLPQQADVEVDDKQVSSCLMKFRSYNF